MLDDVNYIKRDGMTVQSQCHGCQEAKGGGLGWGPQSSWLRENSEESDLEKRICDGLSP
jgi:hypothetical protein